MSEFHINHSTIWYKFWGAPPFFMDLDRLLSIISTSLGFIGSIWLAKGILKLTPDIIAKYSATKWGYNKVQLENITSQKADFVCGIILIAFAFLIQIIYLISVYDSSKKVSVFTSIVTGFICLILIILIYFLNGYLVKKFTTDSQKFLARERLVRLSRNKKISDSEYEDLLRDAEHLCNIKKNDNESPADFLKRYSAYLERDIPDNIERRELKKQARKVGTD